MSVVAQLGVLALLVSSALGCTSQRSDARVPRALAAPEQEGAPAAMQPASLVAPSGQPAAPAADTSSDDVLPGPCPIRAVGARVGVEHLDEGGALVLRTRGDVVALRAQLKSVKLRPTGAALARAVRRLDNVERGMRVVFTAASANDAASVQRELDTYARQLAKRCAMALVEPGSDDDSLASESPSSESDDTHDVGAASEPALSEPDDVDAADDEPPKPEPAGDDADETPETDASEEAGDETDDPGADSGEGDEGEGDEEPPIDGDGDDGEELPDVDPQRGAHHTS